VVGSHWLYGTAFSVVTFLVTLFTTIAILAAQGLYAAILLLPLPAGAIGYLRANFCPLETKQVEERV